MFTPPSGDAVDFALEAYTPPAGNAVDFDFGGVTPPTTTNSNFFLFFYE